MSFKDDIAAAVDEILNAKISAAETKRELDERSKANAKANFEAAQAWFNDTLAPVLSDYKEVLKERKIRCNYVFDAGDVESSPRRPPSASIQIDLPAGWRWEEPTGLAFAYKGDKTIQIVYQKKDGGPYADDAKIIKKMKKAQPDYTPRETSTTWTAMSDAAVKELMDRVALHYIDNCWTAP